MARRKQEGNRFFRLDVDFFSDKKVKPGMGQMGSPYTCISCVRYIRQDII